MDLERARLDALIALVRRGTGGARCPTPARALEALRRSRRLIQAYDELIAHQPSPWERVRALVARVTRERS